MPLRETTLHKHTDTVAPYIPVGVSLAVHLGHDVLVVVVAQRATQLVVVHVGLGLPFPPSPGHLVGIHQLTATWQQ